MFFILIICLFQLFVYDNYHYPSWKLFLNPIQLIKTINNNFKKPTTCFSNIKSLIFIDSGIIYFENTITNQLVKIDSLNNETLTSRFYFYSDKKKIAYITKNGQKLTLNIFDLTGNKLSKIIFDYYNKLNIIQWGKQTPVIYLSYQDKDNNWNIGFLQDEIIRPLVEKINFTKDTLIEAVEPIDELIIYPECSLQCHFVIYNLKTKSKQTTAVINEVKETEFFDINLNYFDTTLSRIIYQIPSSETTYIIDFNSYLWHHIIMQPATGNKISLKGIRTDFKGRKKLIVSSDYKKQAYIYDINYLGLQMIDLKENQKVVEGQINSPQGCLLLEKRNEKEFAIKDINSLEEKVLKTGVDYLQLVP